MKSLQKLNMYGFIPVCMAHYVYMHAPIEGSLAAFYEDEKAVVTMATNTKTLWYVFSRKPTLQGLPVYLEVTSYINILPHVQNLCMHDCPCTH